MKQKIINFHSHHPQAPIISLSPKEYLDHPESVGALLTVGIHPWDTEDETLDDFSVIASVMTDRRVVAIGEVGIDPLRGADIDRQMYLLRLQLKHAEAAGMPVVFHIVRRYDLLVKLYNEFKPRMPWAVHAFRGKEDVVRAFAKHGIYMSLGRQFNASSASLIPDKLLLVETDDNHPDTITEVVEAVAKARNQSTRTVADIAAANLARFISPRHRLD